MERFNSTDIVRRINHCGHIFLPNEFNEWFQGNVRCPVCRFDIRNNVVSRSSGTTTSSTPVTTSTPSTPITSSITGTTGTNEDISNINIIRDPQTNIIDQVSFDISNNMITSDLISTISNRLFESLFNPNNNNNNNDDTFVYDPSNNILMYETIIRPNNGTQR